MFENEFCQQLSAQLNELSPKADSETVVENSGSLGHQEESRSSAHGYNPEI